MVHALPAKPFKKLMKEYNVNHVTSSPHYPQSNGLAEKYIQIVKEPMFHKAKEEGQDLHKCLMTCTETHLCQALCNPQCKCSQTEQQDPDLPLLTVQPDYKWVYVSIIHLTTEQKNHHLPTHDLCINQTVMYQDATTKKLVSSNHNQKM